MQEYLVNPEVPVEDTIVKADGTDQTENLQRAADQGHIFLPRGRIVFCGEVNVNCPVIGQGLWESNLYRATPEARLTLQPNTEYAVFQSFSIISELSTPDYFYGLIKFDDKRGGLKNIVFMNLGFWAPNDGVNAISIKTYDTAPASNILLNNIDVRAVGRMGFEITNDYAEDITTQNSQFHATGLVEHAPGKRHGMGISYAMSGQGRNFKAINNQYWRCAYAAIEIAGNHYGVDIEGERFHAGNGTCITSSGGQQYSMRVRNCVDMSEGNKYKFFACDGAEISNNNIQGKVAIRSSHLDMHHNYIRSNGTAIRFENKANNSLLRKNNIFSKAHGLVFSDSHDNNAFDNTIECAQGYKVAVEVDNASNNRYPKPIQSSET